MKTKRRHQTSIILKDVLEDKKKEAEAQERHLARKVAEGKIVKVKNGNYYLTRKSVNALLSMTGQECI